MTNVSWIKKMQMLCSKQSMLRVAVVILYIHSALPFWTGCLKLSMPILVRTKCLYCRFKGHSLIGKITEPQHCFTAPQPTFYPGRSFPAVNDQKHPLWPHGWNVFHHFIIIISSLIKMIQIWCIYVKQFCYISVFCYVYKV